MEKFKRIFSKVEILAAKYSFWAPFRDFIGGNPSDVYEIVFRPVKDTRSNQQNRYYWAIVRIITDWENKYFDRGWAEDDTHRYLKSEYFVNPWELEEAVRELHSGDLNTRDFLARIMKTIDETTTTDKDTKEFSEIIERIRTDYRNKGLEIEAPDAVPLSAYNDL